MSAGWKLIYTSDQEGSTGSLLYIELSAPAANSNPKRLPAEFATLTPYAIPPPIPPPITIKSTMLIIIQTPFEQQQQQCVFQHVCYHSLMSISKDVVLFYFSIENV